MARYALVAPDYTIYTERDQNRIDFDAGVRDGYRWLPIEVVTDDRSTTEEKVAEPMVQTIEADRVMRTQVIRDKTTQEIEAECTARAEQLVDVDEVTVAMAVATVRLVVAARDGLLAGRSEAFILGRYKAEILDVIRKRRGL